MRNLKLNQINLNKFSKISLTISIFIFLTHDDFWKSCNHHYLCTGVALGLGYLPGGHLPPPKFGHLPPPNSDISHPQKPNICQEDNCHPQIFFSFFGALFLAFSTYSSWRTSRMGRRRCLTRWSWSTSSRRRRWKRSPRW